MEFGSWNLVFGSWNLDFGSKNFYGHHFVVYRNTALKVVILSFSPMRCILTSVLLSGGLLLAGSHVVRAQVSTGGETTVTDTIRTLPRVAVKPPARIVRPKPPKPINREFSFGGQLNSDGWSAILERSAVRTEETREKANMFYDLLNLSLEFTEHKHPKQQKTSTSSDPNGTSKLKPYVFGKINNFYAAKLGVSKSKLIAGKPEPSTVSIHWKYGGGLSVGLLKPYYIVAFAPSSPGASGGLVEQNIKYDENTAPFFLNERNIVGGTFFTEGLGEIEVIPGAHLKTALSFDFAMNKKSVLALETGISAEFYTRPIELMAAQKAVPYFVNLYVGIRFGRRYASKRA